MSINPILNIKTISKDDENLFSLSGVRAITLYGTFFYHRDHQGSIITLTDEYGDVGNSPVVYNDPFGFEEVNNLGLTQREENKIISDILSESIYTWKRDVNRS